MEEEVLPDFKVFRAAYLIMLLNGFGLDTKRLHHILVLKFQLAALDLLILKAGLNFERLNFKKFLDHLRRQRFRGDGNGKRARLLFHDGRGLDLDEWITPNDLDSAKA